MRGVGLVLTEATAVLPKGRITPRCLGLWSAEHMLALQQQVQNVRQLAPQCKLGIQLAHAGRKGSTRPPWMSGGHGATIPVGMEDVPASGCVGFSLVAPSALSYDHGVHMSAPHAMTVEEIHSVVQAFAQSARWADEAGFDVVEVHAAHGYLLHQFLSPVSNQRTDEYGGSFENRIRFLVQVCEAVRQALPEEKLVFLRISCTDWMPEREQSDSELRFSWTLEQSIALCKLLREQKLVDLVDCSSGGLAPEQQLPSPLVAGYQVPFAKEIRKQAGIPTGAVGLIREPSHAEAILQQQHADLVFLARELLRNASWAHQAAYELGHHVPWLLHYERGRLLPSSSTTSTASTTTGVNATTFIKK